MSRVFHINPQLPEPAALRQAAECLLAGGVVIYPTETVYGLGACHSNQAALDRVARMKGRTNQSPFLLLISDTDDLQRVARDISPQALALAHRYWPGPLTLLFKAAPGLSPSVTGVTGSVGCRISPHPVTRALLSNVGAPIISTSANLSGGDNPACLAEIPVDLLAAADITLDGGPTADRTPSTIVDATGSTLKLIRRGPLDIPGILR
jgi:L-threonylcarbamoyladenylate synthase